MDFGFDESPRRLTKEASVAEYGIVGEELFAVAGAVKKRDFPCSLFSEQFTIWSVFEGYSRSSTSISKAKA